MKRLYGEEIPAQRMMKVEKSMKNILKVMDGRKKVREKYKNHLVLEYAKDKKRQFKK